MVHSIVAVPMVGKLRRDQEQSGGSPSKEDQKEKTFAQVLEAASEEQAVIAPRECRTVTYGRNSQIQYFLYRTKEYRY